MGLRGVLPREAKLLFGDLLASNEAIHDGLVARTAELDHDVVHNGRESGIADQR